MNFYPRSPCGERPPAGKVRPWASHISIHALLAESDGSFIEYVHNAEISIHALLAESDAAQGARSQGILKFLSTLSLRRATDLFYNTDPASGISIHALLAESDGERGN